MKTNADELLAALTAVEHARESHVGMRPMLSAVLVEYHEGEVWAITSDNYRVAMSRIRATDAPGDLRCNIPGANLPVLFAFLKMLSAVPVEWEFLDGGVVRWSTGRDEYRFRQYDGTYPDAWQLLDDAAPFMVGINPRYFADIAKGVGRNVAVKIRGAGPLKPLFVETPDYREIIMPTRMADTDRDAFPEA